MIKAEILTIGDEILYGQIIDTNSQWIGTEMAKIGINIVAKTSVGDIASNIIDALTIASKRANIVLITGGLGPTKDDITKKTLCDFFETTTYLHQEALAEVTSYFAKRGKQISEVNQGQALLPIGSIYLRNQWGTAPGMWFEKNNCVFVSMPGVPSEMKGLMTVEVIPKLLEKFNPPSIIHKIIRTIGIGESVLSELLSDWEDALPEGLKLAYLPSQSQVKLRITGIGNDKELINSLIEIQTQKMLPLIQEYVYGFGQIEIEEAVGKILLEKGLTIATAESCTGGFLASKLTAVAGSSAYFEGSVVAYSYFLKEKLLEVSNDTLTKYGAVSEKTVIEMAQNCRRILCTDIAISTSGIAGPGGGMPDKPVGTVWTAIAYGDKVFTKKLQLGGNREQNIYNTALLSLDFLRKVLA